MKPATPPPLPAPSRNGGVPKPEQFRTELEEIDRETSAERERTREARERLDKEEAAITEKANTRRQKAAAALLVVEMKETERLRAELDALKQHTPERLEEIRSRAAKDVQDQAGLLAAEADAEELRLRDALHAAEMKERESLFEQRRAAEGDLGHLEWIVSASTEQTRRHEALARHYLTLAFVEMAKARRSHALALQHEQTARARAKELDRSAVASVGNDPCFVGSDTPDYPHEALKWLPAGSNYTGYEAGLPSLPVFTLP